MMPSSFTAYAVPDTAPSMSTQAEDTYVRDSLKESTRGKRDKGVHRKVTGETFVSLASNPFQLLNLYGKHSYRSSKD